MHENIGKKLDLSRKQTPLMETFTLLSHYLISLREKYGVSRLQWAEQSGVSRITLWRWEAGVTFPRSSELENALSALNATPEEREQALRLWNKARGRIPGQKLGNGETPILHRGDLLVAMRLQRNWTQAEASKQSTIPRATLTKWERMDVWPSEDRLRNLLAVYEPSPEEVEFLTSSLFYREETISDLVTLARQVETYSRQWASHEEVVFYQLAEQVNAFAAGKSEAFPLLVRLYADYLKFLVNKSRLREAQLHLERLERFPEISDPECIVLIQLTKSYVNRVILQLEKKQTPKEIAQSVYPFLAPLIPLIDQVGPLQQTSILMALASNLRVQGQLNEALRLSNRAIQMAQFLPEDYQLQYLQERLWLLHEMGQYQQVLEEIPDPLPTLVFFQVTMRLARGRAQLKLGEIEAGRKVLAEAYALTKTHEMPVLGKLIQETLEQTG